jgi:hypothetical protein
MPSVIVNRMRALRMGDGEAPTSAKSRQERRAEMNARFMAQDQQGPRLIQRTRPRRWRAPGSPLSSDDGDYVEPERLMARQASEDRQNQREQALLDEYDESQGFPPSSPESELTTQAETEEEKAARMRRQRRDMLLEDDPDAQVAMLLNQAPPRNQAPRTVVDEYDGSLRQSRYERQDTPRPESPRVDEEATESARQAGEREMWADWANMHVEHYREGTMTWEELVEELQRNSP